MDIKTLLENLREEVSCSVCSDIFTDPKHLPCLHSFCLKCLKQWYRTSDGRDTIRCPKCQAVSRIPESGDLQDLSTSFYLNGLIDVLAVKECRSTQVRCGNCEEKSSETTYCFQCCVFWCKWCVVGHNRKRSNKDHRILSLKDFQDSDYEDMLKRPAFCAKQRHENEELKYYCKKCKMAVCQTCVTLDHSGHDLVHIEEEAERQKTEMKLMIETQKRNLQAKMNAVRKLDEQYAKLVKQGEDAKREIERIFDNLMAILKGEKQKQYAAVEKEIKKSHESLTTQKAEFEHQIKVIKSSVDKADNVLTRSTNAEVVQLKRTLETMLKEVDPKDRDPKPPPILVFVENQKLLQTVNTEEIGTLEISYPTQASQSFAEGKGLEEGIVGGAEEFILTTIDSEGRQCYNKHDRVTVEIKDEKGRECATEVLINGSPFQALGQWSPQRWDRRGKPRKMVASSFFARAKDLKPGKGYKDGAYKIGYSFRDQGRYKVTVMVNEQHVRDSPFSITVKPFQLKPVLSFAGKFGLSFGISMEPWGVAVNSKDEIAVTDCYNHQVQIFDSEGNYLRSFGQQGDKAGEFYNPRGIAFHKNGKIFVADLSNHRIQIFSGEGEYLDMFGGKGSRDYQLSSPCGLSVDSDGNIIVADSGNQQIKIFSPDGKFLMNMGGPGFFTFPIHCIQCNRYVIVSDKCANCIHVFKWDRKIPCYCNDAERLRGDEQFNTPHCLSVNKSGHLMVCDSGNDIIQVFGVNGKFVSKFGTKGRNLGEFKSPRSIAVQSNDRVVVCDSGNNRIQIFDFSKNNN